MSGELDNIIAEKLGAITLGNSNLYRMEIIESLFICDENVYRKYWHRKHEYGENVRLRSNNLCHTIYSSIKSICDRNPLSFPFLLSYFCDKNIFEVIKDELIDSLTCGRYKNPQLRLNVRRYQQSNKNVRDQNDFLYSMHSDDQVEYRIKASIIIESRVKDYITGLTAEEVQYIYKKVSSKVKSFDRNENKKTIYESIIALGFVYGFISSLFFVGNIKLNRMFSFGQILAIIIVPFLTISIFGKLLDCTRSYNVNDDFQDLNVPFIISNETVNRDQINLSFYGSFV